MSRLVCLASVDGLEMRQGAQITTLSIKAVGLLLGFPIPALGRDAVGQIKVSHLCAACILEPYKTYSAPSIS